MLKKDTYCSFCGTVHADNEYPKLCLQCNEYTYSNPIPVAVGVVPVIDANNKIKGMLLCRRNIFPKIGEVALPGGYVESHESWQTALQREVWEESGITINVNSIKLIDAQSTPSFGQILMFGITEPIQESQVDYNFKNAETQEVLVKFSEKLCFPLHQKIFDEIEKLLKGS